MKKRLPFVFLLLAVNAQKGRISLAIAVLDGKRKTPFLCV
jgi:hypothetical protein